MKTDQPKPATGEWTAKYVREMYFDSEDQDDAFDEIASAHNFISGQIRGVERKLAHQADQAASDNADWFDQLCIDLRKLMDMPEEKRPFEVQPILDEVAKRHARMSERKSVHQWLTAQNIPEEENGKRICLLRRLRITLDRLSETEHALAAEREKVGKA